MEKYRKSNTLQPETPELQTGQIPLIKVNAGGKVKNYVNACSSHFKVKITLMHAHPISLVSWSQKLLKK